VILFIIKFQHKGYANSGVYLISFSFSDWPLLHVRNLQENVLFSTLILGSVFSDYVAIYGDPFRW